MTETIPKKRPAPAPVSSERREEMLRVASEVLHERGLQASLQDIADRLGVTYNALYNHFKNRDDLLFHCLLRSTLMVDVHVTASIEAGGTGLEQVVRFLRNFGHAAVRDKMPPGRLAVALSEDAQRALYLAGHDGRQRLRGVIQKGIEDGSIADTDVLVATAWILHAVAWPPDETLHVRTREQMIDTVCDLVRRALAGV